MKFRFPLTELLSAYAPALLSGLLLGLSYPSFPLVRLDFFAWFALVPLLRDLTSNLSFQAYLTRVALAMTVSFLLIPYWLLPASLAGYLAAVMVGSIVLIVPILLLFACQKMLGWRVAVWSLPAIWTVWEWGYHQTELSFGAVRIGNTQARFWWLIQYVDLMGVYGVTFWVILLNVGLACAWGKWQAQRNRCALRPAALFGVVMFGVPLLYTAFVFARAATPMGTASVLLVQPNLDPQQTRDAKAEAAAMQRLVRTTGRAITAQKPDLILWPEVAVPFALPQAGEAQTYLLQAVTRWNTPLLTGALDSQTQNERFNAAVLLTPAADQSAHIAGISHKIIPMPMVERVPYVDRIPALAKWGIQVGAGDFYAKGKAFTPLSFTTANGSVIAIAAPICYEQLYPELTADLVRRGAQLLTVITNEGWFAQTHGAYQLAAFGTMRAIETRRAIARAANTGVTGFVDRFGRFYQTVPWWSEQTLMGQVTLSDELTFYVRHPNWLPQLCGLTLLLLIAITGARNKVRRRNDGGLHSCSRQ